MLIIRSYHFYLVFHDARCRQKFHCTNLGSILSKTLRCCPLHFLFWRQLHFLLWEFLYCSMRTQREEPKQNNCEIDILKQEMKISYIINSKIRQMLNYLPMILRSKADTICCYDTYWCVFDRDICRKMMTNVTEWCQISL